MSLMSSLYIGVSGLGVSQNALNTTAHNLANVGTVGYVRQQVVQSDSSYYSWGTTHISTLQSGLGVDIATVKQVRDMFLDKSYRQELGRQGFYEVQDEAVDEIESMFGELEGATFQDTLKDFWVSLQELGKVPGDLVTRDSMIQNAVTLIERAENIAKQLKDYQINLNTQILNKVNRINKIAEDIDKLNEKISLYESNGLEKANDLRDERNNLLDELGQIISITYKETMNGVVTVSAEGSPLVTDTRVFKMGTVKTSDTSDMLKPVWISYDNAEVFNLDRATSMDNNTDIGSLKGLLVSRGSDSANYTDIPVDTSAADYDSDVIDYNNQVNSSVIKTVQAQFDQLIHGIVTMINDILCPNKEVTLTDGTVLKVLNVDEAPIGTDSSKTVGEALFNRKSMDRYREPTADEILKSNGELTTESKIYNEEDPNDIYSLFTLGEIEINQEVLNDSSKLPLFNKSGTGDYAVETINKLLSKWKEPFATLSPNTLTVNNFNDYYNSFISELATRGQQLNKMSTDQATMVNSIDNQRQQVMGVSSEEELTNLIKYQHAYNASARYINVISEMLEHIVTRL